MHKRVLLFFVLALLFIAALPLVACGNDDDDKDQDTTPRGVDSKDAPARQDPGAWCDPWDEREKPDFCP